MADKILVIGASRFGSNIANERSLSGDDVIIIDKNNEAFNKLSTDFGGYAIHGEATDLAVLENAGISKAREVVVATNDDNTNIYLAHLCDSIYKVPLIIVRISDYDKKSLLENRKNIHAIYPFTLSMDKYKALKGEK